MRASHDVSTFALDVYWASGFAPDRALEAHLAECTRCRGYLEGLRCLEAAASVPGAAALLKAFASPIAPSQSTRGRRIHVAALGAVAFAAIVALCLHGSPMTRVDYVGVKGSSAAQLLVRRDGSTRIWDGRSPVHPGDALALRVACEGLDHVAVAAPVAAQWRLMSAVGCPAQGEPLPFTLNVDDRPGDERLAVVLSRNKMDERAIRQAIAEDQRTRDVWVVNLVLPKETDK